MAVSVGLAYMVGAAHTNVVSGRVSLPTDIVYRHHQIYSKCPERRFSRVVQNLVEISPTIFEPEDAR
jgi:RNAse (barnase) inhibitor barstar